jgi:hypothetical protein
MVNVRLLLVAVASLAALVTGCSGSQSQPANGSGSQTSQPTSQSNDSVSITGTPTSAIAAGQTYNFAPSARDTLGNALTFSIINMPSWASFDASTGQLSGTPTTAGTYTGIVISATDGSVSASLAPFGITVGAGSGPVTVSWVPPANGTAVANLAGYHIYYGSSTDGTTEIVNVPSASQTSYSFTGLTSGTTYYFAISAYDSSGAQSPQSQIVSITT